MIRFFIILVILVISLILLFLGGERFNWWQAPSFSVEITLILGIFTGVLFSYLDKIRIHQPDIFSSFYLLSIAVKLIGGLALMGAVFWLDKPSAFGNAIVFLVGYCVFTGVEVFFLVLKK